MQSNLLKPYPNADEVFMQAALKSPKYKNNHALKKLACSFQKEFIEHVNNRHKAAIARSDVYFDSYIYAFTEVVNGKFQCLSITLGDQIYRDIYTINKSFEELAEVAALLQFIFDNAIEMITLLIGMFYKDHSPVIKSSAHIERIVFPDDDPSNQSLLKVVYHIEYMAKQ